MKALFNLDMFASLLNKAVNYSIQSSNWPLNRIRTSQIELTNESPVTQTAELRSREISQNSRTRLRVHRAVQNFGNNARRGRQRKRGANNTFGKVRRSIFRGREWKLPLFKEAHYFSARNASRLHEQSAFPLCRSCSAVGCQPENGIRGGGGIGVDKIDKLSAWKMQNRCAHTRGLHRHARPRALARHIARVSPYAMNSQADARSPT